MKFAIAVIFTLALAMGVQSSVLPLPWGLAPGSIAVQGPLAWPSAHAPAAITVAQSPAVWGAHGATILGAPGATIVGGPAAWPSAHAPAAVTVAESPAVWGAHGATIVGAHGAALWGAHAPAAAVIAAHAPAAAVIAAHAPAAAVLAAHAPALGGSYVAQTRGAVHTAPLAGHIQSVANVNVAPAPGTI